jgi:hypothetical protein
MSYPEPVVERTKELLQAAKQTSVNVEAGHGAAMSHFFDEGGQDCQYWLG